MKVTPYFNDDIKKCKSNPRHSMLHYLENFNSTELKYSVFCDKIFYEGKEKNDLDHPTFRSTVPYEVLTFLKEYDSIFQMGELTKESYSYIKENLMLVYGDANIVNHDIKAFHYTEKKIIREYLAIPQLDKMFDEDYFNFEWDMHVGQNFSEHRNDYYRDHFIHQIRDMYSMLLLLGRHGFFESIYDALFDKDNGKVTEFTLLKLKEFMYQRQGAYPVTQKIYAQVRERTLELTNALNNSDKMKSRIEHRVQSEEAYSEAYFKKYVIYASCILAGLFHDMGYPICHFLEVRHRISNYSPTMYMFTHNAIDSFDTLASTLNGSLLFTIVSHKEIEKSLSVNKKGRFDHGAYSAIAFLMQFYQNGLIFSLPTEKQCAIELAALAIYNHTRKYQVMDAKVKSNYYQPVFFQNPVSFLLRLCDDLQEWDRRYFEISQESDAPICSKCLLPSIHTSESGKKEYQCACHTSGESFVYTNSFKQSGFMNRKLYLVTTSNLMISETVPVITLQGETITKQKKALYFRIDYDLFKLLNIARINSTYAKFRLKELNDIKKLLKYQTFRSKSNHNLDFDCIYIDYFMTSNPILIKVKILEKYLCSQFLSKHTDKYHIPYEELTVRLKDYTGTRLCDELFKKLHIDDGLKDSFLYKIITQANEDRLFGFYKKLLSICASARNDLNGFDDHKIELEAFLKDYTSNIQNNTMYRDTLTGLVRDCYLQYSKETVISADGTISSTFINEKSPYYKQYQPDSHAREELLSDCVNTYCETENDFNRYDCFDNNYQNRYIGYFADLRLFEMMNQVIQTQYTKRILN